MRITGGFICAAGISAALLSCTSASKPMLHGSESQSYQIEADQPFGPVTSNDIARAKALRPQLRRPFQLAIYLNDSEPDWSWTLKDREEIRDLAEFLKNRQFVSRYFFLNELATASPDPSALRLAAARAGADALLLLKGRSEIVRTFNPLAVLYATLVGYFIFPGTNVDARISIQAALFDVGNGFTYVTTEGEGEGSTFGPGGVVRNDDAVNRAKPRALDSVTQEFLTAFEEL